MPGGGGGGGALKLPVTAASKLRAGPVVVGPGLFQRQAPGPLGDLPEIIMGTG